MPRDNGDTGDKKTSLIHQIARQAHVTFKHFNSSAMGDNKVFLDHRGELSALLTQVRAKDLNIAPRETPEPTNISPPPVTYMHICETEAFSMGVFLLNSGGASIPLHDHPGMNGMLKVLYGKVSIRCFDKMDNNKPPPEDADESETQFDPPLRPSQNQALRRAKLRSTGEYNSEDSGPCLLTPQKDNLHQINAVDGPAAFLDILAPPYDPDDGRDCHYYKVLQTVSSGTEKKLDAPGEGGGEMMWLLEIPQPEDFWCGGEPYPGPEVAL